MDRDPKLSDEAVDAVYRTYRDTNPDASVEEAADKFYRLIEGYKRYLDIEDAVIAYTAATERKGFKAGLLAGIRLSCDVKALDALQRPRVLH